MLVAVAEPLAVELLAVVLLAVELLAVVLLAEPVVLLAVVILAVVLVANNRYRSKGHGYRRCYRCRDRGRYHHPARRHRYRGASPSRPSHLHSGHCRCRLAVFGNNASRLFFLSNLFLPLGKMDLASQFVDPMATQCKRNLFHYNRSGIEISFGPPFGRGSTSIRAAMACYPGTGPSP